MPHSIAEAVKALGINTIEMPHASTEIPLKCLNQQVIMIVHETVGVAEPVEPFNHLRKNAQEELPVTSLLINVHSSVAPGGNVINSPGKLNS